MNYISVVEIEKLWNISERSVRSYCALGKSVKVCTNQEIIRLFIFHKGIVQSHLNILGVIPEFFSE